MKQGKNFIDFPKIWQILKHFTWSFLQTIKHIPIIFDEYSKHKTKPSFLPFNHITSLGDFAIEGKYTYAPTYSSK